MKNLTELVFILDRSGSMSGKEEDTIGGFNNLLEKQKQAEGQALVTTVLFDDRYELLHDRIDIKGIAPITADDYSVRGCTALLDAVGKTINKIKNAQRHTAEEQRPDKTLCTIITDGLENASHEYDFEHIKKLVEQQQEKGWVFAFIGTNIDSISAAGKIGISADMAANYVEDSPGMACCYDAVSEMNLSFRQKNLVPKNWKRKLDEDVKKRGHRHKI